MSKNINNQKLFKIVEDTYQHKGVKNGGPLNEFDKYTDTKSGLNTPN